MPLLLIIGGWLSGISIAVSVIGFIGIAAGWVQAERYPAFEGYSAAAINIALAAVVVGLITRKTWSRPLMIVFWILVLISNAAAIPGHRPGAREVGCTGLIGLGCAAAYLYLKSNVVEYFESLRPVAPAAPQSGGQ